MSEQSEENSDGIRERRLARAFGLHRKIQSTLDGQEKDKVADRRLAIFGIVLLILIVLFAVIGDFFSNETITVIS